MNEKEKLWNQGEIGPGVVVRDVCKDTVNNVIVAVGDNGEIYRRYGAGVGWTHCVSGFGKENHVFGVATDGKGNFVAGGRGGFLVKSDDGGVKWSTKRMKVGDGNVMKVAYGNGMWLAILEKEGKPSSFLKSIDGEVWTEVNLGIPNAACIEFLNGKFMVGTKDKDIFTGNGTEKFRVGRWDESNVQFTAARCVGYNPETGIYFAAGHQCARSTDGVNWFATLDLTKHEQFGKRNIQAIVPFGKDTLFIGEDMLMLKYSGAILEQVGQTGQGSVLSAVLHDDRIITVGSEGERYILLSDLGADAGETIPPGGNPPPPNPESVETRVENVLLSMEREMALIRAIVKGK